MDTIPPNQPADGAMGSSTTTPGLQPDRAVKKPRGPGNRSALRKSIFASRNTRDLGRIACIAALSELYRYRILRTLDLAFALYPDRTLTAALAAASNLAAGLVKDKLVRRHVTRDGLSIYGLTQAGANMLHENGLEDAKAHRSLAEIRHPEHRLWANLLVIAANARGTGAATEGEVLKYEYECGEKTLDANFNIISCIPQKLLRVRLPDNADGTPRYKGLTPDALLTEHNAHTWIEVDMSKRSSDRVSDLQRLINAIGSKLSNDNVLQRLVIFTKSQRCYTNIKGLLTKRSKEQIEMASLYLKATGVEGVFEVWYHPSFADDKTGLKATDAFRGWAQVQVLPNIRQAGEGWYTANWLPFARYDSPQP